MPSIAKAPPRRSYVTILSSDLTGSTRLAANLEAEDYAAVLARIRGIYQQAIDRRDGVIVQVAGDGLIAIFGYPHVAEDDARRAIDAALDIHEQVRASTSATPATPPLAMHSGVHSGLVLLSDGDEVHGRFELLGTATNIASRLGNAAAAGEILVSEATLGPDRTAYRTSERRILSVRGRSEPLAVFGVLARAGSSLPRRGEARFVGRAAELAILDEALDAAVAGGAPRHAIVGPTGVGKTRLAEELLARASARGCAVHHGDCLLTGGAPLQPVLQIVCSILDIDRSQPIAAAVDSLDERLKAMKLEAPEHRAELRRMLARGDGADVGAPRATPEASAHVVRAVLEYAARAAPLVLFIDDWQWADDATRQLIAALAALGARRVLTLVAVRASANSGAAGATIIPLAPFTEAETAAKIAQHIGAPDPFLVRQISASSGGNPLFIEELCHSVRGGDLRLARPADGLGWLDVLIASRFGQLAATQAALVQTAAIIGNVVPAWLFERMTGHDRADPLVRSLAEHDFLFVDRDGAALRFKHGITRDAVYNTIGLERRRAMHADVAVKLHERAAVAVAADFDADLAYHHFAAGDDAAAARHAERAGDRALAASALDRAQAHYRMALSALERIDATQATPARMSRLVERLGVAAVYDPSRDQLELFRRATARAEAEGDLRGMTSARYWLAYISYALGEVGAAIDHCERVIAVAAARNEHGLLVQTQTVLGEACAAAGDYDRALSLLDATIATRRKATTGPGGDGGSAYALACRASVLGDRGDFAAAQRCFDEALALVPGTSHEVEGSVLCWRSAVCIWQGKFEEALHHARAAEVIAERVRTLYVFAMSRALGGYASWMLHRNADALEAIASATAWLEGLDRGLLISLNYGCLADALVSAKRFQEGRRYAVMAMTRARRGDRIGLAMAYRALARAAAEGVGTRGPDHYLARAAAAARRRGAPHETAATLLCGAEIALRAGRHEAAGRLIDEADAAFAVLDMRWHRARAADLRGRLS